MTNLKDSGVDDEIEIPSITKEDVILNPDHNFSNGQIMQKISIGAENFEVIKKTEETEVNLIKRWVTTTKKIEIPIKYEELLVNDKELDSYTEHEITEIFSKIKHKITDIFSLHDKDNDTESKQQEQQVHEKEVQQQLQGQNNDVDGSHSQQQQQSDEIDVKRYDDPDKAESDIESQSSNKNLIPFSVEGKDDKYTLTQKENIIPLWGEEITINKKMVKIGEIVIRKYHTTSKQKIDVDVKSEKIIIKYPDGRQEDIV